MPKTAFKTILFLLPLVFLLNFSCCHAQTDADSETPIEATSESTPSAQQIEPLEGPYYANSDHVTIDETILGDVYAVGGEVDINGDVYGDVFALGGVVNINGNIASSARIAGGQVNINGTVGGNVTAIGGKVYIGKNAQIGLGVVTLAGTVTVDGMIGANLHAYTSSLAINNFVGHNVLATSSQISVGPNAAIFGSFTYTSPQKAAIDVKSTINGTLTQKPIVEKPGRGSGGAGGINILSYLSVIFLGIVIFLVAPKQTLTVSHIIKERPLRSIGVGILTLLIVPVVVLLLLISIIGIPVAIILTGLYLVFMGLNSVFSGLLVGEKIFELIGIKSHKLIMLALGVLILRLSFLIPYIGIVIRTGSLVIALGALALFTREALKELQPREN